MRHPRDTEHCGWKRQPPGYHFATSDYDQFQVIYVFEGALFFQCRKHATSRAPPPAPATAGTLVLLPPHSAFRLFCRDRGYRGVCYIVREDTDLACPPVAGTFAADARVRQSAEMVSRKLRDPTLRAHACAMTAGRMMAFLALEQWEADRTPATAGLARRAREMLDASIYTNAGLREALAGLRCSFRHAERVFRRAFGLTPKAYQARARVAEAARLLRDSTLPVTTIAMELGFSSSQHFATCFRRIEGLSPRRYRARRTVQSRETRSGT